MALSSFVFITDSPYVAVTIPLNIAAYDNVTGAQAMQKAQMAIYLSGQTNPVMFYTQGLDPSSQQLGHPVVNFDIHDILQDMVKIVLPDINSFVFDGSALTIQFYTGITGYYQDGSGNWQAYTEIHYPTEGANLIAVNAALQPGMDHSYLQQFAISNLSPGEPALFLTNAPGNKITGIAESEFLSGFATIDWTNVNLVIQKENYCQNGANSNGMNITTIHELGSSTLYMIGVGPGNINTTIPGFINDQTKSYAVSLANLVPVTFPDGDNGSMESDVNGLTVTYSPGYPVHSSEKAYQGGYSALINGSQLSASVSGNVSTYNILGHSTSVTLSASSTYYLNAYIYLQRETGFVIPSTMTISLNNTAGSFTDAEIIATNIADLSQGNIYDQWVPLYLQIKTGTASLSGKFEIIGNTENESFHNLNIFVDEIQLNLSTTLTETKSYRVDTDCHAAPTRVHFLNRIGVMDSYTFTGTEKSTLKVDNAQYQQYRDHTAGISNRGRRLQSVSAIEVLTCSSDSLTAAEAEWLEEMLSSPEVYIQRNGEYIPVIVQADSFETRNDENNNLTLSVNLQLANDVVVQRN